MGLDVEVRGGRLAFNAALGGGIGGGRGALGAAGLGLCGLLGGFVITDCDFTTFNEIGFRGLIQQSIIQYLDTSPCIRIIGGIAFTTLTLLEVKVEISLVTWAGKALIMIVSEWSFGWTVDDGEEGA